MYQSLYSFGDWISDDNNIYVGLISITISGTSSIEQNLHKHSCTTTEFRKFFTENTTTSEQQNDKQKIQIHEEQHMRNLQPKLNRIYS